ncbi:MAG TPA: lysylphosphatidylglycerol synthase transmembrane domain-containing protein [Chloroflexota bacterium]|nr:lysylphosphatidylglycerol synthase transmembrane domain-containing protein [Chloroflexota bacterium]
MRRALARLVEPRTLLGIGAGLSLLLTVGSLADWREVAATARRLPVPLVLVATIAHLFGAACRAARWLLMLRGSGLRVPWRPALAAAFGSELFGPLPASPLVASYLLHRSGAAGAATTIPVVLAGLWGEVVVVVGGTALVPDAAPPAVRLGAALICGAAVVGAVCLRWSALHAIVWWLGRLAARGGQALFGWWRGSARWWDVLDDLRSWTPGATAAFGPRALVPAVALTALPVALGTSITAAIAASLGYPQLTAPRAWAIAGAVMVLALASPLPFDLGVVEGGNMLGYSWIGVPGAAAVTIGLLGRFTGALIGFGLSAGVTWALRRELDAR